MLRDFELFMPALTPVVLESKNIPAAEAASGKTHEAAHAALLRSYDDKSAKALQSALGNLDSAKFSGAAREDLMMAERRIGEAAVAFLPKGQAATATRLAALTAGWKDFPAGTLVHIQTTPTATIAWLASGTRVRAESGTVLLRRSRISMQPAKPRLKAMASAPDTADIVFKVSEMVASKLPGPYGQAAGTAIGVASFLRDIIAPQPSDVEIIITAVLEAINKAVAEIEGFIVDLELKKGNAKIKAAYQWLSSAAVQIAGARTVGEQMAFAHTALKEIPEFAKELREYMLLLPTLGVPGNAKNNHTARLMAIHLLALATSALFALDKMHMQFTAFAAANAAHDSDDTVNHADHVQETWLKLKLDVLGADSDLSRGPVPMWNLAKNSFVRAYFEMFHEVWAERAATISVHFFFGTIYIHDTSYGDDNQERWSVGAWQGRLGQLGVPADIAQLDTWVPENFDRQIGAYVQYMSQLEVNDERLQEKQDALYSVVETLPAWNQALSDWGKIVADAPVPEKAAV